MPQSTPTDLKNTTAASAAVDPSLSAEGYSKTLGRRHVTMIAMGGAIGVGLFMGAGGRLASTGPALIFSYAIAGVIAYLLMRALGELIMYRQTSGSFVSYAGEMFGRKGAYPVRLDVLHQLGHDRHRRTHRDRPLLPVLLPQRPR